MPKIKVYINPLKISALDFSNVLTLAHECDRPGESISRGVQHMPKNSSGLISDDERKTIDSVVQFSRENGLDCEIVDLNKAGRMTQLKFILKGWKVPVICFGNETIIGAPTQKELELLLRKKPAAKNHVFA